MYQQAHLRHDPASGAAAPLKSDALLVFEYQICLPTVARRRQTAFVCPNNLQG